MPEARAQTAAIPGPEVEGPGRSHASSRRRFWRSALFPAALVLWSASILASFYALARYEAEPGDAAAAPPTWPAATSLERAPDAHTLVFFAHPRCPCTRASMAELEEIMEHARRAKVRVDATVVFFKPSTAYTDWEKTESWRHAQRIAGVRVAVDRDGGEAAVFGARTSGQVLLYAPAGDLLYSGGITAARGHAGDNLGRRTLLARLGLGDGVQRPAPVAAGAVTPEASLEPATRPVYGCPIREPSRPAQAGP